MTAKGNHFQWSEPEQTPGRKLGASEVLLPRGGGEEKKNKHDV